MPIAGTGPAPKINKGSSNAFKPPTVAITILGVRVSPQALSTLFPTIGNERKILDAYHKDI